MSAHFVLQWTAGKHLLDHVYSGPHAERDLMADIVKGEFSGTIDQIDHYDTDEHIADDVTADIAINIANTFNAGDEVPARLWDFIEEFAGWEYLQGLRRADPTFAAP
jgi:hypothetical protein